jgi:hypothetical protein
VSIIHPAAIGTSRGWRDDRWRGWPGKKLEETGGNWKESERMEDTEEVIEEEKEEDQRRTGEPEEVMSGR